MRVYREVSEATQRALELHTNIGRQTAQAAASSWSSWLDARCSVVGIIIVGATRRRVVVVVGARTTIVSGSLSLRRHPPSSRSSSSPHRGGCCFVVVVVVVVACGLWLLWAHRARIGPCGGDSG